jgi:hypothetical protein
MTIKKYIKLLCCILLFAGCSTTGALEEGEQLYTGLKKIEYKDYDNNKHFINTKEEIEAALAAAPNGALFGSSYYRSPFLWKLWLWNATAGSKSGFGHWLNKTFTSQPVLMTDINPALRAKVAETTLANNGYFRGSVDFEQITLKNPKEGKIAYTVNMGHLFTLDSIAYKRFTPEMDSLINTSLSDSYLKKGEGFSIAALDLERQRLSALFRNNGYYFYKPGYSSYLADTLANSGQVQLRLQMIDSLDNKISRKWYIGNTDIYMRKQFGRDVPDSIRRRSITMHFKGKKPPMRPRVILSDMKLRRGKLFSEDAYKESLSRLTANENFSAVDFRFTPRDSTMSCDTLDMAIDCVFNKPYDISIEGKFTGKTTSRVGPGAELTLSRRNALRYGEKISLNVFGSIEWQTGGSGTSSNVGVNSYEYGTNVTLEFPRLLLPFLKRRRWYTAPSTVIKASNQVINRGSFFNRHIMSGELTYSVQPTETNKHIFSPLILEYDYMNRMTSKFEEIMNANPYLKISMMDQFIPKLRYTYIYTSPSRYRNPIVWESTISESANLLSLAYLVDGHSWNEKKKNLFKNPYAQFLKFETDFTKKWHVSNHTDLVGHINAGVIWSYGNSSDAPYSEQFYVGGANSVRAFTVRAIGPGRYHTETAGLSYLDQTGDIKFVANLEYRPRLFGNLYGALFLDAGNVWAMHDNGYRGSESVFKWKSIIHDMAVGTGLGIRYDMDFFVIRVDWGVGLHIPYDTGKSGFFNIKSFKDCQSVHLAIGYPF